MNNQFGDTRKYFNIEEFENLNGDKLTRSLGEPF